LDEKGEKQEKPTEEWDPLAIFREARLQNEGDRKGQQLRTVPANDDEEVLEALDGSISDEDAAVLVRNKFRDEIPDGFLSDSQLAVYKRLFGDPKIVSSKDKFVEEQAEAQVVAQQIQHMSQGEWQPIKKKENPWLANESEEIIDEEEEEFDEDEEDDIDDDVEDSYTKPPTTKTTEGLKEFYPTDQNYLRTHPLTLASRWGTTPTTLQFPKASFTLPIADLLADTNPKHLINTAETLFGGPGLPYTPNTPANSRTLPQKPIPVRPQQTRMAPLTADSFLVAVMPQTFAGIMSVLVETRKRLGKEWLQQLMERGGGQVLDVGGGGAGVLAWREIMQAEWDGKPDEVPMGRGTVIMGSDTLRYRSSRLLENTSFIPRLPDPIPKLAEEGAPERKTYDVIIAPHSLWSVEKDLHRRHFVQTLWSLLNPNGGLLIILEKGVPRGFEAVAGARQYLLDNHIATPPPRPIETIDAAISTPEEIEVARKALESYETGQEDKEQGMIVAPCTNHTTCPLYLVPGLGQGRKDWCHFKQRYLRPSFLQSVLGAKRRNHDDVEFSYIAVRRGVDLRASESLYQDEQATDKAFLGYAGRPEEDPEKAHSHSLPLFDEAESSSTPSDNISANSQAKLNAADPSYWAQQSFNPLTLPRLLLPPLKRKGHILLDVCTPTGSYERWLVNRRNGKQAWRDARKSAWGDLWALGAWGREFRRANLGTVKKVGKSGKKGKGDKISGKEVLSKEEREDIREEEREAKRMAGDAVE
jgi:ribosomal protein RSM22 (predicted rRNA methylase)